MKLNITEAKETMVKKANERISPLNITVGDYVYLNEVATGPGRKLQPNFSGPYIVNRIESPHLIKLRIQMAKENIACRYI